MDLSNFDVLNLILAFPTMNVLNLVLFLLNFDVLNKILLKNQLDFGYIKSGCICILFGCIKLGCIKFYLEVSNLDVLIFIYVYTILMY